MDPLSTKKILNDKRQHIFCNVMQVIILASKVLKMQYSECVSVALITKQIMSKRNPILLSLPCLSLLYFYNYLNNCTIFRKKLMNVKYFSCSSLKSCLKNYIPKISCGDIIIYISYNVKYRYYCQIFLNNKFSRNFVWKFS